MCLGRSLALWTAHVWLTCGRHHERTTVASGTGAQSGRPSMQGRRSGRVKVCGSSQYRVGRVAAGSPRRDRVLQPEPVLPKARPQEDRASSGPPPAQEKLVGSERCVCGCRMS